MTIMNYRREILVLDDSQLELFVLDWVKSKTESYVDATRFSGAGDMGRDVVGFLTKNKHEGSWHNYQCKQYAKAIQTNIALCEIGKILYYASQGEFSVPTGYFFVVPRGVNRNLEKLIFNPNLFKQKLISEWDSHCANKISDGKIIHLDSALSDLIDAFDFSTINRVNLDDILNDPSSKPALFKWFGADPGPAPRGAVPEKIDDGELPYINRLIDAYSEREGVKFPDHEAISSHPKHIKHLAVQRERFYDADAFKRFYRDNTNAVVIESFEKDIYHGIFDTCEGNHSDALDCVNAVMQQAANVHPSGPLAQHAHVPVKQGVCHHFANEGKIEWRKK